MRRVILRFPALLLLIVFVLPVRAERPLDVGGCRNAKWGMTEAEVLKAFSGEVSRLTTSKLFQKRGEATLFGDLTIAGHSLRAYFVFGDPDRRLSAIILREQPENSPDAAAAAEKLRQQLTEKYGKPDDSTVGVSSQKLLWYFTSTKITLDFLADSVGGKAFTILAVFYERTDAQDLSKL